MGGDCFEESTRQLAKKRSQNRQKKDVEDAWEAKDGTSNLGGLEGHESLWGHTQDAPRTHLGTTGTPGIQIITSSIAQLVQSRRPFQFRFSFVSISCFDFFLRLF